MRKLARFVNALANRCERWHYRCGCGFVNPCAPAPDPFPSGCGYTNPCG